jgi:hypothetical protein
MASQSSSDKQYYLITNVRSTSSSSSDQEIDLHAQSWKLPYTIDDKDLMFDGKPLNLLYEENRYMAEHRGSSREHVSTHFTISNIFRGSRLTTNREEEVARRSEWGIHGIERKGKGCVGFLGMKVPDKKVSGRDHMPDEKDHEHEHDHDHQRRGAIFAPHPPHFNLPYIYSRTRSRSRRQGDGFSTLLSTGEERIESRDTGRDRVHSGRGNGDEKDEG